MKVVQEADTVRLVAEQDFLITNSAVLQGELMSSTQEVKSGSIILDLCQTTLMDSVGIKLVIGLYKTCVQKGLTLQIEASSPTILKLFQICKLNEMLTVREMAHG